MINFNNIKPETKVGFKGGVGETIHRTFNDGKVIINKVIIPPGSNVGLHKHEGNFEVIYILSGKGEFVLDGETEVLGPGDCHYCPDGSSHTFKCLGGENVVLFCVVPAQK